MPHWISKRSNEKQVSNLEWPKAQVKMMEKGQNQKKNNQISHLNKRII